MKNAICHCGQLSAVCPDEHLLHAECGCIDCQRRTGTPSSFQVWYKASDVELDGEFNVYTRTALTGTTPSFKFCPNCGSTVLVEAPMGIAIWGEDIVQIPVGCFFDPDFAAPDVAVWTSGLPSWFNPIPPSNFCDESQFESLEEIKATLTALGKL